VFVRSSIITTLKSYNVNSKCILVLISKGSDTAHFCSSVTKEDYITAFSKDVVKATGTILADIFHNMKNGVMKLIWSLLRNRDNGTRTIRKQKTQRGEQDSKSDKRNLFFVAKKSLKKCGDREMRGHFSLQWIRTKWVFQTTTTSSRNQWILVL